MNFKAASLLVLMVCLSSVAFSQTSAAGFKDGDLYLFSPSYGGPGDYGAILHIDPITGAVSVLVDFSYSAMVRPAMTYDPWRDRIVFYGAANGAPAQMYLCDAQGGLQGLGPLVSTPIELTTGPDGIVYFNDSSGAGRFLSPSNVVLELMNAAGFQFFYSESRLHYDSGTNSLFTAAAARGNCPPSTYEDIDIFKFGLSEDGTQVLSETCFKYSADDDTVTEWSAGLCSGPDGALLLTVRANDQPPAQQLATIDPVLEVATGFATVNHSGWYGTYGGGYSHIRGAAVLVDSVFHVLRLYQEGEYGAGAILAAGISTLATPATLLEIDLPAECETAPLGGIETYGVISDDLGGFMGNSGCKVDTFSRAIAWIGDVDGDGIDDMAVGDPQDDESGAYDGAVWILFMKTDGTVRAEQKLGIYDGNIPFPGIGEAGDAGGRFGASIAGLGDLDGDGVPDIAVGEALDDVNTFQRQGEVWILFLNPDGTVKSGHTSFSGGLEPSFSYLGWFGWSLAMPGDVDGDGVNDLVVGQPGLEFGPHLDPNTHCSGAIWVLFLNRDGTFREKTEISNGVSGFLGDPTQTPCGGAGSDMVHPTRLGSSLTAMGDSDGDGLVEIAVGDKGAFGQGAVWLLNLSTTGTVDRQTLITDGVNSYIGAGAGSEFGSALAAVGDLDGNGVMDLAVGTQRADLVGGVGDEGLVEILFLDRAGRVMDQVRYDTSLLTDGGPMAPLTDRFGQALAWNPHTGAGTGTLSVGSHAMPGVLWQLDLIETATSIAPDVDNGEGVVLTPTSCGVAPAASSQVAFLNTAGVDDATLIVAEAEDSPNSDAPGFGLLAPVLNVETSLSDGEFFMTVIVSFDVYDLEGLNPLAMDLSYYEPVQGAWKLAASGNTMDSPGHMGSRIGDRSAALGIVTPDPPVPSQDLGDYGVFWNGAEQTGYVWANVDHATEFSGGFPHRKNRPAVAR